MEKTTIHSEENAIDNEQITPKFFCQQLLSSVGITINGNQPFDIQVHNEHLYKRVIKEGALGLGESYTDNWWDCERLDVFFEKILRGKLDTKIKLPLQFKIKQLLAMIFNYQTKKRAKHVAERHYDLDND